MELSEAEDRARGHLAVYGFALGGATQLLHHLLTLQCGLDATERQAMAAAWPARVYDEWADTTDAAISFLLKTTLAKGGKPEARPLPGALSPPSFVLTYQSSRSHAPAGAEASLAALQDTRSLGKHLGQFCDRLSKGGKLKLSPAALS
jgi:hypothetical protein